MTDRTKTVAEALKPFLYDLNGPDLHMRAAQAAIAAMNKGVCLSGDSSLKGTAKSIPCESEAPAMTPEAAPKREPGPKRPNYKVLGDRCPECGDNLIHNNKVVESLTESLGVACNTTASGSLDPDMPSQKLRLHMGEMTAQEERTARAAVRWANSCRQADAPTEAEVREAFEAWLKDGKSQKLYDTEFCRQAFQACNNWRNERAKDEG